MKNNTLLLILTLFLFSKQGFAQTISVYGSTVGEANVTPSGAASYIIPIHTPRGVNGFQPNISIIYNSQSGNGILGYGWNISGLSSISRVPSTIYFDGITEGVNLNRMDKLALDGNRLICINADSTEFKTELENFSKIIGGKSDVSYYWFEVKTKDGSTNYYGTTEDSRLRPLGNWSQPLAWYLSKSTDPNGNSINYFYTNQNGEIYIDRIEYANNSIQFIYEDRPDKNVTYFAGASVSQKKRLKGITVKSDGQVARSYSFTYNHDGLFSHLASISETGSDGASLNPTQFIREGINANSTAYSALVETQSYKQIYNADLTGDGRSDVVVTYKSSVESNWTDWAFYEANADGHSFTKKYSGKLPSGFKGFYLSDIDNNGTYDIFMRVSGVYSYCCIQCDELKPQNAIVKPDSLLTKSDAIFKEHSEKTVLPPDDDSNGCCATCSYDRQYMNAYFYSNGNLVRNEQYDIHFDFIKGDAIIYAGLNFDGDGKSDFLILDKSKNFVGVKVGNTYFSAQVFSNNPNDVNLLDYNGDGRTDILVTKEYNSTIYTYNPRSTKFEVLYNSGFPTRWHSVHLGDFNGDGKTDILSYTAGKWNLNFSTGKEFSYPAITNLPFYNANPDDNELMSLFIGDFNGDGRDDVLQTLAYNRDATSNYYYFYISDGMGGFKLLSSGTWDFGVKIAQILKEKSFLGFSWDRKWTSYNGHALADFNGDGKIDVLPYHGKPNARQAIILPFSNDRSRQLLSIVDGIGRQTNFTYKSLTEGSSIYQKGTGATYPLNDIIAPLYVVSSISQPNGIGGTTTTSFLYKGAKIHLLGKGFLGFTEVIASNSSTGIVTTQQFETNTTFYLNLLLKTLVMSSGTKLSEITYTNRLQSFGGKRFAQFIDKIEVFKNPENITFTTTYQYDSYGNATYVKESCPIRTIETTNNYALYGGWGPYNRLTSSTVKTTYSGKTSYIRSISF